MADPDRDDRVSTAYRALGAEEPPRAVDAAVLAAARRKPARWRVPLSLAAVLVLALGVTLRVQRETPDAEPVALAPQVLEVPPPAAAPAPRASVAADAARAAPAAPASATAGVAAESRMRAELAAKPSSPAATPEAWLARIAELRRQNRMREAQESLAEFRKRYPDYRIPQALR